MNPIDEQLQRLFRGARMTDREIMSAPYGLETRVLAAWRSRRQNEATFWDRGLLIRGLILAILIMGISFWPVLTRTTDPYSAYLQVADSTVTTDVTP